MGILNATPDSFSDGGAYLDPSVATRRVVEMVRQGADSIDIGGESTRPGASLVSSDEELRRTIPVIRAVRAAVGPDIRVSIDTSKSEVAIRALQAGADLLNCCGGFDADKGLIDLAVRKRCAVVIYHRPTDKHPGSSVKDVYTFFQRSIRSGLVRGMRREQFILDPGIGFGKTVKENIDLLHALDRFASFGCPILIGVSRKSHLSTLTKDWPGRGFNGRLESGLAETAIAILNGASIVRTHDVLETKSFVTALDSLIHLKHSHEQNERDHIRA